MANPEHVEIVKRGREATLAWRRANPDALLDLRGGELARTSLVGANLARADLSRADLRNADLGMAELSGANLTLATLSGANLWDAILVNTNLSGTKLDEANLDNAHCLDTVFGNIDLSSTKGLEKIRPIGPSIVGTDTLLQSGGKLPEVFLRNCGLSPWEILQAQLYDPALTAAQISDLQYKIFDLRAHGPMFLGGVFISYSRDDSKFIDKIRERLQEEGAPVWLDRHDLDAGSLQRQISRAIRVNDVVLLVLSEASVQSDWVENELDMARKKEKDEGRNVLCPVALDDSWKSKAFDNDSEERTLWRTLTRKNILDFSNSTVSNRSLVYVQRRQVFTPFPVIEAGKLVPSKAFFAFALKA